MLQFQIAWRYLIGEFTGILLLCGQPKIGIWIVWIFFWTLYFIWMQVGMEESSIPTPSPKHLVLLLVFYEEFRWAAYQISPGRRKGGWRLLECYFFGVNSAWERILIIDNLIRRGMVLANWCILRENIKEMQISCFCILHLLWNFIFSFWSEVGDAKQPKMLKSLLWLCHWSSNTFRNYGMLILLF